MKKFIAVLLALVLTLSVASLAMAEKIGIAMPTESLQRWNLDGANLKALLEAEGHEVELQYANNEVNTQVSQIENMILNGAKILVVASIDGGALDTVLATAKTEGITVIAYDRLLTATKNVDYYATFDNYGVGKIQGQYVIDTLDLDNAAGPFTIEFTAGDPGDNNAGLFFSGAFDLLKPYIDAGKLVITSGQTAFDQCATPAWNSGTAQSRMDNILSAYYPEALTGGLKLDVCLCSNDSTALGVTNSLLAVGFDAETMPIITGQDCDLPNTKNMIKGLQSMSVWKNLFVLGEQTKTMVLDIIAGKTPETNATYNNGIFDVPSYNCVPQFCDVNNYKELLVDSKYYTEAELAD